MRRITRGALLASAIYLLAPATGTLAAPGGGHNDTPGTAVCDGQTFASASGSDLADAIQLLDANGNVISVLLVRSITVDGVSLFPPIAAGGLGEQLTTCTVVETAGSLTGLTLVVTGLLVP